MFEVKEIKTESQEWIIPAVHRARFAIMDIDCHYADGSRWKVTSDYINTIEGVYFNISDIENVIYNSTENVLYLRFQICMKIFNIKCKTIAFKIQYEHVTMCFFEVESGLIIEQTSKLDGHVSLQRLYSAFKDLSHLKGKYAIIDLAGNTWQVDYLCNFYRQEDRRKYFHALTDEFMLI